MSKIVHTPTHKWSTVELHVYCSLGWVHSSAKEENTHSPFAIPAVCLYACFVLLSSARRSGFASLFSPEFFYLIF